MCRRLFRAERNARERPEVRAIDEVAGLGRAERAVVIAERGEHARRGIDVRDGGVGPAVFLCVQIDRVAQDAQIGL